MPRTKNQPIAAAALPAILAMHMTGKTWAEIARQPWPDQNGNQCHYDKSSLRLRAVTFGREGMRRTAPATNGKSQAQSFDRWFRTSYMGWDE
jgi:hypothetical protein